MEHRDLSRRSPSRAGSSQVALVGALALLLLILAALLIWQYLPQRGGPLYDPDAVPRPVSARSPLGTEEESRIALYKEVSPSVVHVTSLSLRRDFSLNIQELPRGTGSGFIWDENGYVVTNYHVIEDASGARVTLADGTAWDAQLVGTSPDKDLAVLKIDAPAAKLKPVRIGTSADLQVGQTVLAIGNPFGLDQTLTTGVISGVGREIQSRSGATIDSVIQTDAAINPGNSGGPLLDSDGRLIGVNTAIYSPSGAYAGVGFAVPVDTVNEIVPQLIRNEPIVRPGLGVVLWEDSIVRALYENDRLDRLGALVRHVLPNSSADDAGILPTRDTRAGIVLGDLIIAVDGEEVQTSRDLHRLLAQHAVGDTVRVTVLRNGSPEDIPVTLQRLPNFNS